MSLGKYEMNEQNKKESRNFFNNSLTKANTTYELLVNLRDKLISEGWKGNSSKNFYTKIAEYINQLGDFRKHLENIVNTLSEATEGETIVNDTARSGVE